MDCKQVARGFELPIAETRVEELAPVLEQLHADVQQVLDRDLSEVEPVGVFRPRGSPA